MPKKKIEIKYEKIHPKATSLVEAYEGDAGLDIATTQKTIISAGVVKPFPTGIKLDIPKGYFAKIEEKSGFSLNTRLALKAGIIDSGYTGEVKVLLFNHSPEPISIEAGTLIAQLTFHEKLNIKLTEAEITKETERGEKGFGSSEKKES